MVSRLRPRTTTRSEESFAALFEESLKHEDVKEGDIVKGTVIQVGKDYVVVDIGYKSEGMIPLDEFADADGTVAVKAGDKVDVFLESRENDDGLVRPLEGEGRQDEGVGRDLAPRASATSSSKAPSAQRVKGGLSVTIRGGVKAFLPARRSTCARSATSTSSSARPTSSRSSSSTRSAATSCSRAACSSRRSATS